MLKKLTLWSALTVSSPLLAVNYTNIALLSKGNISATFYQSVVKPQFSAQSKIVYGNKQYGYWQKSHDGTNAIDILPPGYKHKIHFYTESSTGQWKKIHSQKFVSPDLSLFNEFVEIKTSNSQISVPFIALSVAIPSIEDGVSKRKQSHATAIVNRVGEIIWLHVPGHGKKIVPRGTITKVITPYQLAIMAEWEASTLELVDFKGNISTSITGEKSPVPFVMANDFYISLDQEHLQFMSQKKAYIRNPKKLWQSPTPYLGSTIVDYNWQRQITEEVHNSFLTFNPVTNISASHEEELFYLWDKKPLSHRATDYTSFQPTAEGILVTERLSNSIRILNRHNNGFIWTLSLDESGGDHMLPKLSKKTTIRCARLDSDNKMILMAASKNKTHVIKIDHITNKFLWHIPISNPQNRKSLGCAEPTNDHKTTIAIINENRRGSGKVVEVNDGKVETVWRIRGLGKSSRLTPIYAFGADAPVLPPE